MEKDIYTTKINKLKGHDYKVVHKQALALYKEISSRTKRKPYIRSRYFNKEKVFLDYFWQHLMDKTCNDRVRRLKLYPCALDLIRNNMITAIPQLNRNKLSEKLYRFKGIAPSGDIFCVQIKETKKKERYFISVFPQ